MNVQYRKKGQLATVALREMVEITTVRHTGDHCVAKRRRLTYEYFLAKSITSHEDTLQMKCPVIAIFASTLYDGWLRIETFRRENTEYKGVFLIFESGGWGYTECIRVGRWEDILDQPVPESVLAVRKEIEDACKAQEAWQRRGEEEHKLRLKNMEFMSTQRQLVSDILGVETFEIYGDFTRVSSLILKFDKGVKKLHLWLYNDATICTASEFALKAKELVESWAVSSPTDMKGISHTDQVTGITYKVNWYGELNKNMKVDNSATC